MSNFGHLFFPRAETLIKNHTELCKQCSQAAIKDAVLCGVYATLPHTFVS